MPLISWMQRSIGLLAIIFIGINTLEAASVHRSDSAAEDSVRKCGYDVSVLLTKVHFNEKKLFPFRDSNRQKVLYRKENDVAYCC